jgi:Legume lectin domain
MRQNALFAAVLTAAAVAVPAGAQAGLPAAAPVAPRADISYPSFTASGLTLNGSATVTGGVLRLTGGEPDQAGAAWADVPVDPRSAFDTSFDVATSGPAVHADGFAFVVQADGSRALGGLGGSIGYGGMTHSVAVEFDTYRNRGDLDGNHVAVVSRGRSDLPQPEAARAPVALFGGRLHVRIGYRPGTLTVSLRRAGEAWSHVLTRSVNLAGVLGTGGVRAGFTAATGRSVSTQDILSWRLTQP